MVLLRQERDGLRDDVDAIRNTSFQKTQHIKKLKKHVETLGAVSDVRTLLINLFHFICVVCENIFVAFL